MDSHHPPPPLSLSSPTTPPPLPLTAFPYPHRTFPESPPSTDRNRQLDGYIAIRQSISPFGGWRRPVWAESISKFSLLGFSLCSFYPASSSARLCPERRGRIPKAAMVAAECMTSPPSSSWAATPISPMSSVMNFSKILASASSTCGFASIALSVFFSSFKLQAILLF